MWPAAVCCLQSSIQMIQVFGVFESKRGVFANVSDMPCKVLRHNVCKTWCVKDIVVSLVSPRCKVYTAHSSRVAAFHSQLSRISGFKFCVFGFKFSGLICAVGRLPLVL